MEKKQLVAMTPMEKQLIGNSCMSCHHTGIRMVTDGEQYSILCPTCGKTAEPSSNRMLAAYSYRTHDNG